MFSPLPKPPLALIFLHSQCVVIPECNCQKGALTSQDKLRLSKVQIYSCTCIPHAVLHLVANVIALVAERPAHVVTHLDGFVNWSITN